MISKINILSFFVGSFLGVAQLVSKLILMNKYSSVSLIYGGFVAFFYIISSAIWIKILKSSISISSAYGFVILGFFIAITIYNYLHASWHICAYMALFYIFRSRVQRCYTLLSAVRIKRTQFAIRQP